METISDKIASVLIAVEEDVVAEFNKIAGLGEEYRVAHTSAEIDHALSVFMEQGYVIMRGVICNKTYDGVAYRLSLVHDDIEVAHQDIGIKIETSGMVMQNE